MVELMYHPVEVPEAFALVLLIICKTHVSYKIARSDRTVHDPINACQFAGNLHFWNIHKLVPLNLCEQISRYWS